MRGRDHTIDRLIILAIDALDPHMVEEFNCSNLKLDYHGRTDITEYEEARTVVLWSSFLTGRNCEEEVMAHGKDTMWNTSYSIEDTFLGAFNNPFIYNVPGYNYDSEFMCSIRKLMQDYHNTLDISHLWAFNDKLMEYHIMSKDKFLAALDVSYDLLLPYFGIADLMGHMHFSSRGMMRLIYDEIEDVAEYAIRTGDKLLIISDHGMKLGTKWGEHSKEYGYWATNFADLGMPKITDLRGIIEDLRCTS